MVIISKILLERKTPLIPAHGAGVRQRTGGDWPRWTKTRLVTVLLMGLAVAACGGGGVAPVTPQTAAPPATQVSPSSPVFGNQAMGTSSTPKAVIVSNNSSAALAISKVVASGDFTQANTCGSTI